MTDVSQNQPNIDDDERDRGILGTADRQYIRGEKEYAHRQTAYERRQTIKNRVQHSLVDLTLLAIEADDELLTEVFGEYTQNPTWKGMVDAVTLMFRVTAIEEGWTNKGGGKTNRRFERLLETAVRRGYFIEDCVVDEFRYHTTTTHIPDLDSIKDHARSDEELSPELIRLILREDLVDTDEVQEIIRQQILELPEEPDPEK